MRRAQPDPDPVRGPSLTFASLVGGSASVAPAFAHGILGGESDAGGSLSWFYGAMALAVLAVFVLRKRIGGGRSPERRELKRRLGDLERALAYREAQLRSAEDYPHECGRTAPQRRALLDSTASIRHQIDETRAALTTPAPG